MKKHGSFNPISLSLENNIFRSAYEKKGTAALYSTAKRINNFIKLLQSNPISKNGKLIIWSGKYLLDTAASALHSNK
jgi:hypothetical protein